MLLSQHDYMAKVLRGSPALCPPPHRTLIQGRDPHTSSSVHFLAHTLLSLCKHHPRCGTSPGERHRHCPGRPRGDTPPPLTCRFSRCPGCSGCSSSTGRRWGRRSPGHRIRGGTDLGRERRAQPGERLSIPRRHGQDALSTPSLDRRTWGRGWGPSTYLILCLLSYKSYISYPMELHGSGCSPLLQLIPPKHESHPTILQLNTPVQEEL